MDIAIIIPCHGRERLAEAVINYHMKIPHTVVIPVWEDIKPLGKKFNDSIEWLKGKDYNIQGAMIVGSDDIIHEKYFAAIRISKPLYCELERCFWYNGETGDMWCTPGMEVGAGKYFSNRFLQRCSYRPYVDELDRNVDRGPKRFLAPQYERQGVDIPWIIDIKGPESMHSWEKSIGQRRSYQVDAVESFKEFGLAEKDWRGLV